MPIEPKGNSEEIVWRKHQYFPGEIEVEEKKEAAKTAAEWEGRKNTIWTDGGGRSHLGKNKEAFDAVLCALYQAAKTFEGREEEEQQYTIFTDSTAAIARVRSNDAGSGQSVAIVAIESCERRQQPHDR